VAVEPPEVTIGTEVSLNGMVVVVVPPLEVRTCETIGDEVSMLMVEADWTNDELETEVTTEPDSVMTGVLEAGAGV
jgi:hypothetical protein